MLFVTGANSGFFNSLLVTLQSFAERMPGRRLLVCDYGLHPAQAEFLRRLGVLLEAPPKLPSRNVFYCKAALLRYLRHSGDASAEDTTAIWLDGDLTFMDVGPRDFEAVVTAMKSAGARIAACREPAGRGLGQMTAAVADAARMAPFADAITAAGVDPALPYFSSGLFVCDSPAFLARWDEMTLAVEHHPLFEQNMFNLALHRDRVACMALDCEEWQAQGYSLDRLELRAAPPGGRAAAFVGAKNIKTLHATSPAPGHLLIAPCRLTVRELELVGTFKLLMAERLRMHQLELLARFVLTHGEALVRLGICTRAASPAEGFHFTTLPGP